MMTEHSFAWDIVSDLNAVWREDEQCRTWDVLGKNNPYKSQIKAVVKEKLQQYQEKLDSYTPTDLELKATLRSSDLDELYQHSSKQCDRLNTEALYDFKRNMILTLRDLTIGYAAAAVFAYYKKGIVFHLPESFYAVEDALAASADAQDLTDSDTFLEILHKSTNRERKQCQPQHRPKDVILNNDTAVSLMKKLQDVGKLDIDYQWLPDALNGEPMTIRGMSIFANYICTCANIHNWNQVFGDLWGVSARSLTKALSTIDKDTSLSPDTKHMYRHLVDIFNS